MHTYREMRQANKKALILTSERGDSTILPNCNSVVNVILAEGAIWGFGREVYDDYARQCEEMQMY